MILVLINYMKNIIWMFHLLMKVFFHFSFNIINKVRSSDVVHFSSFFYKLTIWYFFLTFIFNKKIVISPRGEFYEPALRRKRIKISI